MKVRLLISIGIAIVLLVGIILVLAKSSSAKGPHFVVIGRDPTMAPLAIQDRADKLLAFLDELLLAIFIEEKTNIRLVSRPYDELFADLDKKQLDGIVTLQGPSKSIESYYRLSENLLPLGSLLIVRKNSEISSADQLDNKLIGILRDSPLITLDLEKMPSLIVITYDTPVAALESLIKNKIDGVVMDLFVASPYIQTFYAGQVKTIDLPGSNQKGLRLVTRKDPSSSHLVDLFNQGFDLLKTNGKYQELLIKWGL